MTILFFLAVCIFFTILFHGSLVYFEDKRNPLNRTFALGCITIALAVFVIFMTLQSQNSINVLFWVKLHFLIYFIMPFFLHYVLLFTRSAWLRYKFSYIFLYLPPFIFAIVHLKITQLDPIQQSWGYTYNWHSFIWLCLRNIWLTIEALLFVVLCFVHSSKATGKEKTQTKYLGVTFTALVVSGTLLFAIGSALNVKFSLEMLFIVVALPFTLTIVYLMRNNKLFTINPATAAANIIATMNESLILLDRNNRISSLNQAASNLLGFTEDELIGRPVNIILSADNFQNELTKMKAFGESINNFETEFTTKTGNRIPISLSGSLLKNKQGNLGGAVVVAWDISERNQAIHSLQESKEKYRLLIENAGAAIWIVDCSGRVEYMNHMAMNLFMVKPDGQTGKTLLELFPKPLADGFIKGILDVIKSQKGVIMETSIAFPDNVRWFDINLQLIPDSQNIVSKVQIIANDITELKQNEQALIGQTKKLAKFNTELQEFIFIASHDLQEPLQTIIAFGIRLEAIYFDSLTDQGRDYLGRMQRAVIRMQTLINDLQTYSQVIMKEQVNITIDLTQIIKEVVSELALQIEQTGGAVEVGSLSIIEADPVQIRQLLQNLIENALKFCKSDIPPVVKISSSIINDDTGPQNEFIVEDNGIGMEEKYLNRIFGVFQRLQGRDEYEGNGIGLAICKKIVERHNGSIFAESKPGVGTRFIIRIPIKPVQN